LPEIDAKEKFRPTKNTEPIENSISLQYDRNKAFIERKEDQKAHDDNELDSVLKNIRTILMNLPQKL